MEGKDGVGAPAPAAAVSLRSPSSRGGNAVGHSDGANCITGGSGVASSQGPDPEWSGFEGSEGSQDPGL